MSASIWSILFSIPSPLMESLWWALWSLSEWVWTSCLMEPRYNRAKATEMTRSDPLIQPDLILMLLCMSCALFCLAQKEKRRRKYSFIFNFRCSSLHPLHANTVTHPDAPWQYYLISSHRFAGSVAFTLLSLRCMTPGIQGVYHYL